jgi:putative transposase
MPQFDPDRYRRRSIRLKDYDYTQHGAYFVTICAYNRQCWFGEVADDRMRLNARGETVVECWSQIPEHFPGCELDEFVAMPNHVHGILLIVEQEDKRVQGAGAACCAPTNTPVRGVVRPGSLSAVIRSFKAAVSRQINAAGDSPGEVLWQRNYYEHIIRNEDELNQIRQYIAENPLKWSVDRENVAVHNLIAI